MNELSLNQGIDHRELCKSRLKEKAINCYKDEGLQNQIYEKFLETLGHFGKFITRIDQLNYQGLASASNWLILTLKLAKQENDIIEILSKNLKSGLLHNNSEVLIGIDNFLQGVAAFGQASYSLLTTLRHHLFSAYLFEGNQTLRVLFQQIDPESILEGFNSTYCGELFVLSKIVSESREDYEYLVSTTNDSHKIRIKQFEALITILTHSSYYIGSPVKERRVDGTLLSRIVEFILSFLEKHSRVVNTQNSRRQGELVRSFLVSLDYTFNSRLRKIEQANLECKIRRGHLSQDQVKILYDIDKMTLSNLFTNFVILIVNPSLPSSKQLDAGQEPRKLWLEFSLHHKSVLQAQILKRVGYLFLNEKQSERQEKDTPETYLFAEELKKTRNFSILTAETSPLLNTTGIIEIVDNSSGFDSQASLLKALRRMAPMFEKENINLRYHRVIFVSQEVRRGLLIISKTQNSIKFFSFKAVDSLTGSSWQLSEYKGKE